MLGSQSEIEKKKDLKKGKGLLVISMGWDRVCFLFFNFSVILCNFLQIFCNFSVTLFLY